MLADATIEPSRSGRGTGERSRRSNQPCSMSRARFTPVAATWTATLALRFKTQSGAPLMQASMFTAVLFTPAYAPQHLLTGVIEDIARINPVSKLVVAIRQCFVGDVTWATTWPALVVIAVLVSVCAGLALREIARTGA